MTSFLEKNPALTPDEDFDLKPFGGCGTLLGHYKSVGSALLDYERKISKRLYYVLYPSYKLDQQFSTAVSFVGVEVLESYLDDLLDLNISDESLFILRPWASWQRISLGVSFGIIAMLGAAAYSLLDAGGLALFSCAATLSMAIICTVLICLPRPKILRRFGFATLLSHEILRRRGNDGRGNRRSVLSLSEFLGRREYAGGGFASSILNFEDWDISDQTSTKHLLH